MTNFKPGERFDFGGYNWIALDTVNEGYGDGVLAIMASAWNGKTYSFDKDDNNNYAKSSLRRKLLNELLPVLGEDNLLPHVVDLVADNGDDRYGTVTDKVFILSCDEYRKYRKHVPLLPEWMWTCTPWYITDAGSGYVVRSVGTTGYLGNYFAHVSGGVAPACVFSVEALLTKKPSPSISEINEALRTLSKFCSSHFKCAKCPMEYCITVDEEEDENA